MAEEYSNVSPSNENDPNTDMDEPDSDFVINKNFKGFRKKFKGVDIDSENLESPISTQQSKNDSDVWHTTSQKKYTMSPELTTNSEVIWNSSG